MVAFVDVVLMNERDWCLQGRRVDSL
jgi:hypothetical protein